jgi:hypothetical protein
MVIDSKTTFTLYNQHNAHVLYFIFYTQSLMKTVAMYGHLTSFTKATIAMDVTFH